MQESLEGLRAALLIWQREEDELIESARSQDSRMDNLLSVGGAHDSHLLFGAHPVYLRHNQQSLGVKSLAF